VTLTVWHTTAFEWFHDVSGKSHIRMPLKRDVEQRWRCVVWVVSSAIRRDVKKRGRKRRDTLCLLSICLLWTGQRSHHRLDAHRTCCDQSFLTQLFLPFLPSSSITLRVKGQKVKGHSCYDLSAKSRNLELFVIRFRPIALARFSSWHITNDLTSLTCQVCGVSLCNELASCRCCGHVVVKLT